jgi:hypothetical protein
MSITFPLALPSVRGLKRVTFSDIVVAGFSQSPFSLAQETFEHQGDLWGATLEFTEMERADAEEWIGWRMALGGLIGTFPLGDPVNTTPRGTWSAPIVSGAHAAGVKTLNIIGVDGKSWKRGDWFQLGSGSSATLHKVVQDGLQAGSPSVAQVEFWPRLRNALTGGETLTLTSPKGVFRLAGNSGRWALDPEIGYLLPPLEVIEAR